MSRNRYILFFILNSSALLGALLWLFFDPGFEPVVTSLCLGATLIGLSFGHKSKQIKAPTLWSDSSVHQSSEERTIDQIGKNVEKSKAVEDAKPKATENFSSTNLGPNEIIACLNSTYISDRPGVIRELLPRIDPGVNGRELAKILSQLYISDRLDALKMLRSKIKPSMESKELKAILSTLYISDRPDAVKIIGSIKQLLEK